MEQSTQTELVGILNITTDSFYDGGKYCDPETAIARADELFRQGASLVDIGGQSTRPGATKLTVEEEWARLEPILNAHLPFAPETLSIDTFYPEIIRRVVAEIGKVVVNDVTGLSDPLMVDVIAEHGLKCIVSHLPAVVRGDIQEAHELRPVEHEQQVRDELLVRCLELEKAGVSKEQIILDPGIGFGKPLGLNWELLTFADHVDYDVMIGYSNKRFLRTDIATGKPIIPDHKLTPEEDKAWMNEQNLLAAKFAVLSGAKYLRVHDVALHRKFLTSLHK